MKHAILIIIMGLVITTTGCTKITITNNAEEIEAPQEIVVEEPEIQIDMTNKNQVIDYALLALKN